MACAAKRVRVRAALPLGCALAALWATPASAESDFKLISADTLELTGDVRIAALDGERSWVEGGYGKLRTSGGGSVVRVVPELGNVNLVWQPRFTWSLSAVVSVRSRAAIALRRASARPISISGRCAATSSPSRRARA